MKTVWLGLIIILSAGCTATVSSQNSEKFVRIFNWGFLKNEEIARRYYLSGVTDIRVNSRKQLDLAKKYNMTPYFGCFSPAGPHLQVISAEEEKHRRYIHGLDLPRSISRKERAAILAKRRKEKDHRFGGRPTHQHDVLSTMIPCFISDTDLRLSKAKMDKLLARAIPGVRGVFFDYIGYSNCRGCYCSGCLKLCKEFLQQHALADTPQNRALFYREQLVNYCNAMIDYLKSKRPDFKVVAHFYPDFKYDLFYGSRTRADFGGITVAWYFKEPLPVISRSTGKVVADEKIYNQDIMSIPFLGLNINKDSALGYKTPAEVDAELRAILSAGGKTLMVCNGDTMIAPGYFEVFKKYSNALH